MKSRPLSVALGFLLLCISQASADLIHHYKFDTDASDSAGSANGTLSGGANVSGGMLNLDGSTGFVQFSSYLIPGSGNYSVAMFAKWTGGTVHLAEMISQGRTGGPGFFMGTDNTGKVRLTDTWQNTGVNYPTDGALHHFALTVDASGGASYFYLDGALKATFNSAITTTQVTTFTRLGRQFQDWTEYYHGSLDDVRIYNNTLSASEVANLAGVPEPGSALLAGIAGLFGMTQFRRRR